MPLVKLPRGAPRRKTRKQMLNWFVLASVPLYLGAGLYSLRHGNAMMAGAWLCWAAANTFLLFAEMDK